MITIATRFLQAAAFTRCKPVRIACQPLSFSAVTFRDLSCGKMKSPLAYPKESHLIS
jgi:hypothetical protein